jgi:phosphocarrier protein HPr
MPAPDGIDNPATIRRMVMVCNKRGLHARAAAKLVKLAGEFDAEVRVAKNGSVVSGRSIMGLMMLAAGPGCQIEIVAEGAEAQPAVDALVELVEAKFDEDQ